MRPTNPTTTTTAATATTTTTFTPKPTGALAAALHSRRDALRLGAAGALAAIGLNFPPLASSTALAAEATPGATQGPYWVDEMLNRSDIRTDPTTGVEQPGLPLRLAVGVQQPERSDARAQVVPARYAALAPRSVWRPKRRRTAATG